MLACLNRAAALASRSNRCRCSAVEAAFGIHLIATSRAVASSRARYTTPAPPLPRISPITKPGIEGRMRRAYRRADRRHKRVDPSQVTPLVLALEPSGVTSRCATAPFPKDLRLAPPELRPRRGWRNDMRSVCLVSVGVVLVGVAYAQQSLFPSNPPASRVLPPAPANLWDVSLIDSGEFLRPQYPSLRTSLDGRIGISAKVE